MLEIPKKIYKGYIFDCDGTLADSMDLHFHSWKLALMQHGAKFELTPQLFYSLAGVPPAEAVKLFISEFKDNICPQTVVDTQRELTREHLKNVKPHQPVLDFARKLFENQTPISVASGGERDVVYKTLELIGALDLFKVIVTQNDVNKGKPAPDSFLLAAELMGVPPYECLVIEDGIPGIEAANAANMDSVLVKTKWTELAEEPTLS